MEYTQESLRELAERIYRNGDSSMRIVGIHSTNGWQITDLPPKI